MDVGNSFTPCVPTSTFTRRRFPYGKGWYNPILFPILIIIIHFYITFEESEAAMADELAQQAHDATRLYSINIS